MEVDFKISDPTNAIDRLMALPGYLKKKALRAAMRKGANVWAKAARQKAATFDDPETPLSVAKSIAVQESGRAGKRVGGIVMRVGVRGGAKSQSGVPTSPWYWRFKEFGTANQSADPFMRPAFEENKMQAVNAVVSSLRPAIDKVASKSFHARAYLRGMD